MDLAAGHVSHCTALSCIARYTALSCWGALFWLEGNDESTRGNDGAFLRRWTKQIGAVALFVAASTVRSNGIVNVAIPLWTAGVHLLRSLLAASGSHDVARTAAVLAATAAACWCITLPARAFQAYGEGVVCGFEDKGADPNANATLQDWLYRTSGGLLDSGWKGGPLAGRGGAGRVDMTQGGTRAVRFCEADNRSMGLYRYIQWHHWNNGPFQYWQLKQIPNFLLATPILAITYYSLRNFTRDWALVRLPAFLDSAERKKGKRMTAYDRLRVRADCVLTVR